MCARNFKMEKRKSCKSAAVSKLGARISYSVSEEVGGVSEEKWSQVVVSIRDEDAAVDTVHTDFS